MLGKTKVVWSLVFALVLVSLSTQATTVSSPGTGGEWTPSVEKFDIQESVDWDHESGISISQEGCPGGTEIAKIGLFVRWGLLGGGGEEEPDRSAEQDRRVRMVPWDGFVQTTDGAVRLVKTVLFESGGNYSLGGDDFIYPRSNRFTLEWRSSTTVHWDGLLMLLYIPITRPMPHVTLHTEQWSHVFEAGQLIGLQVRIPVGDQGDEIEIKGFMVKEEPRKLAFAVILFAARWGYLDDLAEPDSSGMVPWDGFISVTRGAVKLIRPLRFEYGGWYRLGTDDLIYPRTNRFTLEWRSSTTVNWDGVLIALIVPLTRIPEVHMTFHTEQWSHVFSVSQLLGLHKRFPIDPLGHEIELDSRIVLHKSECGDEGPKAVRGMTCEQNSSFDLFEDVNEQLSVSWRDARGNLSPRYFLEESCFTLVEFNLKSGENTDNGGE